MAAKSLLELDLQETILKILHIALWSWYDVQRGIPLDGYWGTVV